MLDNDALHSSILDLDSCPLKVPKDLSNASSAMAIRLRLLIVCFKVKSGLLESARILAKATSILCPINKKSNQPKQILPLNLTVLSLFQALSKLSSYKLLRM